ENLRHAQRGTADRADPPVAPRLVENPLYGVDTVLQFAPAVVGIETKLALVIAQAAHLANDRDIAFEHVEEGIHGPYAAVNVAAKRNGPRAVRRGVTGEDYGGIDARPIAHRDTDIVNVDRVGVDEVYHDGQHAAHTRCDSHVE